MRPGPKFALMRATFLHLRFPFVYILSPIFVWGAAWGPGGWTARTALAFLLVHLALYPGANAFNSAYDRDTGPIGGLARPPVVPAGLGRWSVWLQGVGAALSLVVGPLFATGYAALWGIFTAYSHPRTRWKRSPIASTAAIVAGQGGIGYWLGWSAAGTAEPAPRSIGSVWTAAALGARGTLAWSTACFAAAAIALAGAGAGGLVAFAGGAAALAGAGAAAWPAGRVPSHREVMTVAYVTSTVFLAAMVWRASLGAPA